MGEVNVFREEKSHVTVARPTLTASVAMWSKTICSKCSVTCATSSDRSNK